MKTEKFKNIGKCDDGEHCVSSLDSRVSVLETKSDIIFDQIKSIDKKIWFVLTGLILGFLMTIIVTVI